MRLHAKRYVGLTGALLACFVLVGVASSFAQNLGEAARQERARKKNQPRRSTHVYTEDDLKRPQILRPGDRERAEAARGKSATPAAEQAAEVPGALPKPAEISLGDIARHYRLLKQIREKQVLGQAPQLAGAPALASPSFSKAPYVAAPAATADLPIVEPVVVEPQRSTEARAQHQVRVRRGDSLWRLAKRHLGRGAEWRELAAANPQITDPALIRIGEWIRLPFVASSSPSAKQFRVRKGDSLWKLAQAEFGRGQAWSCIARANPEIRDANLIYAGQTLVMPAPCTATP